MQTFLFLTADGLANGAIYALLGLGIVIIYLVTRVINIAHGDFAMLSAMTLVSLEQGQMPPTCALVVCGILVWTVADCFASWRRHGGFAWRVLCHGLVAAMAAFALPALLLAWGAPRWALIAMAVLLVGVLGPIFYRLAIEPIPKASVLVYIIVTLGAHLVVQGVSLHLWGPQAMSVAPMLSGSVTLGPIAMSYQALLVIAITAITMACLFSAFAWTLHGKALRAASLNQVGAVLCGIGVQQSGRVAFLVGASLAALAGVLLAPLVGVHYEMGFLVGLKGFVGATMGGLASYPGAVIGAMTIGVLESCFAYLSSAYRDALVFTLIVPLLLLQSRLAARRGGSHEH